jgi:hypothetical protein
MPEVDLERSVAVILPLWLMDVVVASLKSLSPVLIDDHCAYFLSFVPVE